MNKKQYYPSAFRGLTQIQKDEYINSLLHDFGAELIGHYETYHKKFTFRITEGKYRGYIGDTKKAVLETKVKVGKTKEFALDILLPEEQLRYFDDFAKSRGYTILKYPENNSVTAPMEFLSPQENVWHTHWNSFTTKKRGRYKECPLDNNISYGVRVVSTILKANNIDFVVEKGVLTGDTYQFFDFYVPELNMAIEYNGQQHYMNTAGYFGDTLARVQELDARKYKYCEEQGIKMVIVPYTHDTITKAMTILTEHLDLPIVPEYVDKTEHIKAEDVMAYYDTHSAEETMEKFDITVSRLAKMRVRTDSNKQKRAVIGTNLTTKEKTEYESVSEAKRQTGCCSVSNVLTGKNKTTVGSDGHKYAWEYKEQPVAPTFSQETARAEVTATNEEIISYYETHSKEETLDKFSDNGLTFTRLERIRAEEGHNKRFTPVTGMCINTDVITEYPTYSEAIQAYGGPDINRCLKRKDKITTNPEGHTFIWKYKDEEFTDGLYEKQKGILWIKEHEAEIVEYYKDHQMPEVLAHFSSYPLTKARVRNMFDRAGLKKRKPKSK